MCNSRSAPWTQPSLTNLWWIHTPSRRRAYWCYLSKKNDRKTGQQQARFILKSKSYSLKRTVWRVFLHINYISMMHFSRDFTLAVCRVQNTCSVAFIARPNISLGATSYVLCVKNYSIILRSVVWRTPNRVWFVRSACSLFLFFNIRLLGRIWQVSDAKHHVFTICRQKRDELIAGHTFDRHLIKSIKRIVNVISREPTVSLSVCQSIHVKCLQLQGSAAAHAASWPFHYMQRFSRNLSFERKSNDSTGRIYVEVIVFAPWQSQHLISIAWGPTSRHHGRWSLNGNNTTWRWSPGLDVGLLLTPQQHNGKRHTMVDISKRCNLERLTSPMYTSHMPVTSKDLCLPNVADACTVWRLTMFLTRHLILRR